MFNIIHFNTLISLALGGNIPIVIVLTWSKFYVNPTVRCGLNLSGLIIGYYNGVKIISC